MIIVTGGAGFIGSNIVRSLNQDGISDILVVDNLSNADKIKNLADLKISDYLDKHEFYELMRTGGSPGPVSAVFHQGACSDTMETDGKYVLHNNFTYSKTLFHFCQQHKAQFIYASSASVYGDGSIFIEDTANESALNAYAWSKLLFDNYIRNQNPIDIQCVGLRYFNVYGPREFHKGRMASVAWHFYNQYRDNGVVKPFVGTDGYDDGGQLRDFVYVDDVVDVNLYLLKNPQINGIYNVGTGKCQSFNDVALAVINCWRNHQGKDKIELPEATASGEIDYIPLPEALVGKYQSYTQAELSNLRGTGYDQAAKNVTQGVEKYFDYLSTHFC